MMKTILAALAAFPMAAGAADLASHVAPGTVEVTGTSSLGLSSASVDTESGGAKGSTDTTDVGLAAGALYYVAPNVGVGVHGGYGYRRAEFLGTHVSSWDLSVGPIVSYQVPVAPQLALFGRASGSWIHGSASTFGLSSGGGATSGPDVTTNGWGFGAQAGLKWFPVKAVSFDGGLGWSWSRVEQTAPLTSKLTSTSSNLVLDVGISVYFGGASH
jgi:hypothetical protein